MYVDAALMPELARGWPRPVSIVIDVLRASSSLVLLLELGADRVYPVAELKGARSLAGQLGALLAGERGGVPPPDFDLGNSPSQIQHMDMAGRNVVLTTSNGTAAIQSVEHSHSILMGCFNNATACCKRALEIAREAETMIGLVCSGQDGGFALDDGVCAGFLVGTLKKLSGNQCRLSDAALAMEKLSNSFDHVQQAFALSTSGRNIDKIGDQGDLEFCAQVDSSQVVPYLTHEGCFRR